MRLLLFLFALSSLTFEQTFEVKDKHSLVVVTVHIVTLFTYAAYLERDIPSFDATVTNVSGEHLGHVPLYVTVSLKDGTTTFFWINAYGLRKDGTVHATYAFVEPWAYTPQNFESVTFSLASDFMSPEDKRLLAVQKEKDDAAEAERQSIWAAEQEKKNTELDEQNRVRNLRIEKEDALQAARGAERRRQLRKEEAAQAVRAAEERRRVRAACSGIYQNTVDKKVKDLTVGEEQQVRACQALGLYPPR